MKVLITGGAGFIGINLAHRLLTRGDSVSIFDNFSRRGSQANLTWLRASHSVRPTIVEGDLRDTSALAPAVADAEVIYHLGGQVAVTTSVQNPRADFESNALGTLNVLEAARTAGHKPIILYASTNKVYGALEGAQVREGDTRYAFVDLVHGVPETWPLDFHSPYGCSKGAGDQYVRDYARIFDLPTVVFRQSCIYGYRQFGVEDQGWVAWMVIAGHTGVPITIYGNGKQVRDVLFIDDLLDAYDCAIQRIDTTKGQIYNIGGGPEHSMSVWSEFGPLLSELVGRDIPASFNAWRPGDQPIYISDIRKAKNDLGWSPKISVRDGISRLYKWVSTSAEIG